MVGRARRADGEPLEIRADLVVGADGRHSTVRERAGFKVDNLGAPMDVLWLRCRASDPTRPSRPGPFRPAQILVMLNRGDYWQCAYVIPKGGSSEKRARASTRSATKIVALMRRSSPTGSASSRLGRRQAADRASIGWSNGGGRACSASATRRTRCRRSAASAVNLAIQDAVAAANILGRPLREGRLTDR